MRLKTSKCLCIVMTILILAAPALRAGEEGEEAEEPEKVYSWNQKLGRGFAGIIASPVELARRFHVAAGREGSSTRRWVGLLGVPCFFALRVGAGVVDFLTFPFNFPDPNKGPLMQPEYPWQSD